MGRTSAQVVENNFIGGYVTEATGLNFPPSACTEAFDCVFDETGTVTRRPGYDFEPNFETTTIDTSNTTIVGFTWKNVGNIGSNNIRVVQIGTLLHLYEIDQQSSLSSQLIAETIDLTDYLANPDVDITINRCSFAATNKNLIVVHPNLDPFYISYDPTTDTFSSAPITIGIRDFTGVTDPLDVDERPAINIGSITKEHLYNLYNQGWYFNNQAALTQWDTDRSDLPSNADIWWYYKNVDDEFDTSTIDNQDPGNTPAPQGHYVLNVFDQDRSAASGIAGFDATTTGDQRFSNTAFFAGRVWYSGLGYTGFGNKLYFSQILERDEQLGMCYQQQDPTSEIDGLLLPSDGGELLIFEVETVIKMFPMSTSLLVFCTNGIWAISGSQGIGFTAEDYSVAKISSVPCLSESSFVNVDGMPIWWNTEGIYTVQTSQQGALQVQSLTDKSIRSDYVNLPPRSKLFAVGDYSSHSKTVRWLFRREQSQDSSEDYRFDSILSLNMLTSAFYLWTIPETDIFVHDIFSVLTEGGAQSLDQVVDNSDADIVDNDGNNVVISSLSSSVILPRYKLLVSYASGGSYQVTFGEIANDAYLDWKSYDDIGTDYDSYFVTGFRTDSGLMNFFQSNYVMVFMDDDPTSSCFMQGIWDWATDPSTGKFSQLQQIYNYSMTNHAVNFRRLKVRGKGRALQLKFISQTGKPFSIAGWAIWETGNQGV